MQGHNSLQKWESEWYEPNGRGGRIPELSRTDAVLQLKPRPHKHEDPTFWPQGSRLKTRDISEVISL